MGKGFIRGVIAGAFVSFLSICVVSILSNAQRAFGPVSSGSQDIAVQELPDSADSATPSGLPAEAPEADTIAAVQNSDIAPGAVPEAGSTSAVSGLAPVAAPEDVAAPAQDAPVVPNAAISTPERPATEPELSISTDPAQPPAPAVETATSALGDPVAPAQPEAPAETETESASTATSDPETTSSAPAETAEAPAATSGEDAAAQASEQTALVEDAQAAAIAAAAAAALSSTDTASPTLPSEDGPGTDAEDALAQAAADAARAAEEERAREQARLDREARFAELARAAEAARLAAEAEAAAAATREAQVAAASQAAQAQPGTAPIAPAPTATPSTTVALPVVTSPGSADTAPATPTNPESPPVAAEEEDALRPGIGQPVNTLTDIATGVRTNRLPTLGDPAPEAPVAAAADPADAAADAAPLIRFAAPFENPDDKPLMSIVLMDDGVDLGSGPIGIEALSSFPYPISFAVDVTLPDAAERMAMYRADGFEVLAAIDLPEGATAIDAEVTVAAALSALPETVAIMEGVGSGVQTSRAAAEQVSAILSATGHGFVTQNRGLNTAQKLAARAGVPSAVIFRDFDAEGQTPTVIRRFLDQAAFRARQEGGVIMMGRVREDTISALLVWGLQDRATQVALAPVSAMLATR